MKAVMTEQGLLIPKEEWAQWGEVVVEEKPYQLLVRPKSVTQLTKGIAKGKAGLADQILADIESGVMVEGLLDHEQAP
jgi:hypothetical protein